MKTIAISGSKGFIGSNLIPLLEKSGDKVIPIDIKNGLDLTNWEQLEKFPDFDVFVHLANLTYVPASYERPLDFYTINYLSTLHVLELCRQRKANHIYISSYIYGNPEYLPVDEKHPVHPFNPYAQTKFICESLCQAYERDFNVITTIVRPFNIFGPFQNGDLLIPSIIRQLQQKVTRIQLKDPRPRRDYVYVTDVVNAIQSCIIADFKEGEVFNICSGKSFSVREMTEIIQSLLPFQLDFSFETSDRKSEVFETIGSFDKLHTFTGWEPIIDFKMGIKLLLKAEGVLNNK